MKIITITKLPFLSVIITSYQSKKIKKTSFWYTKTLAQKIVNNNILKYIIVFYDIFDN